jgi:hypothetical protein
MSPKIKTRQLHAPVLLEKLTVIHLVKNFITFHGTQKDSLLQPTTVPYLVPYE